MFCFLWTLSMAFETISTRGVTDVCQSCTVLSTYLILVLNCRTASVRTETYLNRTRMHFVPFAKFPISAPLNRTWFTVSEVPFCGGKTAP